ncbi:MAG: hypothetical protein LBT50_01100 [Prevotellaceae bacterium]|jgi:hypothetical protein|nr:hypothetical protein [Prevotellaceae bacterium]
MAEKRKADYVILLKKKSNGKVRKLEMFNEMQFDDYSAFNRRGSRFRLRANGKWFHEGEKKYFHTYEIRDLLWRTVSWDLNNLQL